MKQRLFLAFAVGISALTACSGKAVAPVPFSQAPPAPVARGAVISVRYVTTFTKSQMNGDLGLEGQVITALGGAPKCTVKLYAIVYQTIGVHGEAAVASEGFFVPGGGCKPPFTMIGYGQGTNDVRAQKITDPTKKNIEPVSLASIFAAHGYAVAATDYLGLGYSTYPYQPYVVANSEASAIVDAMRAARIVAPKLHVALGPKVFLTGYSQGGHSILATQKVVEAENANEFRLIGDSPGSGFYAFTRDTLDLLLHPGKENGAPVLWAYFLTAYQKTYGNVYAQTADTFRSPYATYVENLLPVDTYVEQGDLNGKTLPLKIDSLLQPAFSSAYLKDPIIGARIDVETNDLLHGWKPKAAVYLCGGDRDPVVEYKNSKLAYQYFKDEGVKVSLLDVNPFVPASVPLTEYHDAVFVLCHTFERVYVLDPLKGHARAPGIPDFTAGGSIGPILSPLLP